MSVKNQKEELSILGENYEVIMDKPHVSVYQFLDTKIGYIDWKGQVSFEEYKEGFEALLKRHKQNPSDYFISNIINQGVSSAEKKTWFKEVALKQAFDAGLKKGAVIMDNNPFREFYVNNIMGSTNTMGLPFKTFNDLKQAKDWLISE